MEVATTGIIIDKILDFETNYGKMLTHQFFLFAHLIFFVFAFYLIMREDWKMFRKKEINLKELENTSQIIISLLIGLWISGGALIYLAFGFDFGKMWANPKIAT